MSLDFVFRRGDDNYDQINKVLRYGLFKLKMNAFFVTRRKPAYLYLRGESGVTALYLQEKIKSGVFSN